MAGVTLYSFYNGFAGMVSQEGDVVIKSLPNMDTGPIAFGAPVFLSSDRRGVVNLASGSTADMFVGFAVRSASKTPDTYGSNAASYARGEVVDILLRGAIIVDVTGSGISKGKPVYLDFATGKATANAGSEGSTLALTNAHFGSIKDPNSVAEVIVNTRNVI